LKPLKYRITKKSSSGLRFYANGSKKLKEITWYDIADEQLIDGGLVEIINVLINEINELKRISNKRKRT